MRPPRSEPSPIAALTLATTLMLSVLDASGVVAGQSVVRSDWRQFGGPTRDFHVESSPLSTTWPASGPMEIWRRPLGEGYSSVLVDGETLVTMYRDGEDEVVVALNARNGETRWQHVYHAPLVHDGYFDVWLNAAGPGPYSMPLIVDGIVFAIGVNGHFHALDGGTGAVLWSHDLVELFGLTDYNAFASSPLAYARNLILPLGGKRQRGRRLQS